MEMRTISNRKDIEVPQEYVRHFEVPADFKGQALVDKITEKFGNDWRYLELTDLDFTGATMGGVRFTLATLTDVRFTGATLNAVDFTCATLTDVRFTGATLTDLDFTLATLTDVRFTGATLTDLDFSEATLNAVDFTGATLTDVGFYKAKLKDVTFREATLTDFTFYAATLTHVSFYAATLKDVSFSEATLTDVRFTGATLTDVSFYKATLTGAQNVNFYDTKFTHSAIHERVVLIPEIIWDKQPIAAVLPEGTQPLLISIGCKTHTPEEWLAFTPGELGEMDSRAPNWHTAHMEEAVRRAKEIEKESKKS